MTKGDIADYAELMMNLAKAQRAYIESCKRAARAMHTRMREDGKIPATTPRDCPILEAKRKGL